jgi:hypothetical protein
MTMDNKESAMNTDRRPEGQAPAAPPSIPRELMEGHMAQSHEATFQGFAASPHSPPITRFMERIYDMGFESGWRIRESLGVAAPPSGVQAPVDHRKAFENQWLRYAGHLPRRDGGGYAHGPIDLAWRFWQAALAAAPPVAPAPAREGAEPQWGFRSSTSRTAIRK